MKNSVKALFVILGLSTAVILSACANNSATPEVPVENEDDVQNEQTVFEDENIKVTSPEEDAVIASPVKIEGEAVGPMYFEASFKISVFDDNDTELGSGIATAQGDWMTENFVPFLAEITFSTPGTAEGYILFKKDNPSGLPENDLEIKMPIKF